MKKITVLLILLLVVSLSVSAQGFYFDAGLGFGRVWTKIDGNDVSDIFSGSDVIEMGVDLGFKAGYGPIAGLPLYIVGTIGGMGHGFFDMYHTQFNSYLIGPGVIFYPIPLIQLAGSMGLSFIANQTNIPGIVMLGNDGLGFAGDISVALDFGGSHHGFLLGFRYFVAVNTIEISNVKQNSSVFTVFGRYAFRNKMK